MADPAPDFQSSEVNQSPEIQRDANGPAKEDALDAYWYPLLHETRKAAYQLLERYLASQHPHIQSNDTDLLIQEDFLLVATEDEVRTSLQDLQDLLRQIKSSAINFVMALLFLAFWNLTTAVSFYSITLLVLCIWFATPLHKSKSDWAGYVWTPTGFLVSEAGWEFLLWLLVCRCVANTVFVQRQLDEGQLRLRDRYRLRGWMWTLVGYVHRGKAEGPDRTSEIR